MFIQDNSLVWLDDIGTKTNFIEHVQAFSSKNGPLVMGQPLVVA